MRKYVPKSVPTERGTNMKCNFSNDEFVNQTETIVYQTQHLQLDEGATNLLTMCDIAEEQGKYTYYSGKE